MDPEKQEVSEKHLLLHDQISRLSQTADDAKKLLSQINGANKRDSADSPVAEKVGTTPCLQDFLSDSPSRLALIREDIQDTLTAIKESLFSC